MPGTKESFEGDRQFVTALARGLEILRAFRPSENGATNAELAERTGLRPSTVSRLTYTLTRLGYLRYDARTARYHLGVAVLGLGFVSLAGFSIRASAQPLMQELAEEVGNGHLVALSTRDMLTMRYVACARSRGVVSLTLDVGSHINLARSSAGRCYLAACPDAEREEVMEAILAQTPAQERETLRVSIEASVERVHRDGFCLNLGQWRPEVNVAAVPIVPGGGDSNVYALSCGGPSYLLPVEKLEREVAPRLMNVARQIIAQRSL